ncbi:unnamed protein product, partial [marine sediment metagenome]
MVTLTIDEREFQAEEGATILEVARDNNIYIPTLCSNEAVSPYGACRLCLVEIVTRGRTRLVVSCLYAIEEGLVVKTNSERIANHRKVLMELLLARCPQLEVIKDLAKRLGAERTPFKLDNKECILCGLCVR